MNKKKIQLMQLNNNYGNQYYLPYSIGVLSAYVKQFTEITNCFEFQPFIYKREPLEIIVSKIGNVDVFAVSSYSWGWELSKQVGRQVRDLNPEALIIYGGPHVPDDCPDFFIENEFIDIAVHGEGEAVFLEILKEYTSSSDFSNIPGISYNDKKKDQVIHNSKSARNTTFSDLPSPYLNGEFDLLMENNPGIEWMAPWETNRGCPFKCTFCDWGSATASKVVEFGWDKITQEIEWFAKNKIGYILGCDANFGIRKRDIEIAKLLVASKEKTGYPKDFAVCFTKNSTQAIFGVGEILHAGGMLKAVSISMQSLNENALVAIKRDNIKLDVFKELLAKYNHAGITTFTELILGLPGETYESFADGICTLLDNGQHSQIFIYNCSIMPNAEMGSRTYQEQYEIKTVAIPIFTAHSKHDFNNTVVEYDQIIVQTKNMSIDAWRKMHHFSWIVQSFHMLGLLQSVAIFLRYNVNINYRDFYEALLEYGYNNPESCIGSELLILNEVLDRVLAGGEYGQYLYEFSDISWPVEEASFLRFSKRKNELYEEINLIILNYLNSKKISMGHDLLGELISYQKIIVANPEDEHDVEIDLNFNIPEVVSAYRNGDEMKLLEAKNSYNIIRPNRCNGDLELFSRTVVWYGRKRGKLSYKCVPVT